MIQIALYQPDIAQNTGTIARLCACLDLRLTIIEPAGFAWTDVGLRRAGMDYLYKVDIRRSTSWSHFRAENSSHRLVLLTTRATSTCYGFAFEPNDILVLGRESAGVPEQVHDDVACRVAIPMAPGNRSLNVAIACAIAAGEACRQLRPSHPIWSGAIPTNAA